MKTLLTFILCLLSVTAFGQYRPQTYTTNRQAIVDSHVLNLVGSGPTNGITASVATNIAAYQAKLVTNNLPSDYIASNGGKGTNLHVFSTLTMEPTNGTGNFVFWNDAGTLTIDSATPVRFLNRVIADEGFEAVSEPFYGDASGVSNLNASRLDSGTVPIGRLSAPLQLLSTNNGVNLTNLQVAAFPYLPQPSAQTLSNVVNIASNKYVGSFYGLGSGLSNAVVLIEGTNIALITNDNRTYTIHGTSTGTGSGQTNNVIVIGGLNTTVTSNAVAGVTTYTVNASSTNYGIFSYLYSRTFPSLGDAGSVDPLCNLYTNVGVFTTTNLFQIGAGGGIMFGDDDVCAEPGISFQGDRFIISHTDFNPANAIIDIWPTNSTSNGRVIINPDWQLFVSSIVSTGPNEFGDVVATSIAGKIASSAVTNDAGSRVAYLSDVTGTSGALTNNEARAVVLTSTLTQTNASATTNIELSKLERGTLYGNGIGAGTVANWVHRPVEHTFNWTTPGEMTVIYETGAKFIATADPVFKCWATDNSGHGGIEYGESLDGVTWTTNGLYSMMGYGRGWVLKEGSYYYFFGCPIPTGSSHYDLWRSSEGTNWTSIVSNIVTIGSPGDWDETGLGNVSVVKSGSTFYMLYEARSDDNGDFDIGLATSANLTNWTKCGRVINWPSGVGGIGLNTNGNGGAWGFVHAAPKTPGLQVPTDIYMMHSPDFTNWTVLNQGRPIIWRRGPIQAPSNDSNVDGSQIADPVAVEVGGSTYLFYAGTPNQGTPYAYGLHPQAWVSVFPVPLNSIEAFCTNSSTWVWGDLNVAGDASVGTPALRVTKNGVDAYSTFAVKQITNGNHSIEATPNTVDIAVPLTARNITVSNVVSRTNRMDGMVLGRLWRDAVGVIPPADSAIVQGRVGIGTVAPSAQLDAYAENANLVMYLHNTNSTGMQFQLRSEYTGGTWWMTNLSANIGLANGSGSVRGYFYIDAQDQGQQVDVILSKLGGNVGIGSATLPTEKLTVTGNIKASGTVTAGFNGVAQPLHAHGSLMMIGDETVDIITQSAYVVVTNYDAMVTNLFTGHAVQGALTNTSAGWYNIRVAGSGLGTTSNAQLYEGGIFTNLVECTLIEWQRSVSSTSRGSWAAEGTIYLPAGCRIDARIKSDAASPDDITLGRYTLTVASP